MNRLNFKKIRYRNLLSAGQMWVEIQLDRSPSTMITGKNGSGKSAGILDALYFALFGKPFRKINKPQLVNTKNGKDLLVELEFECDSDTYLIRRGSLPDVFDVLKNGEKQNINGDSRAFQKQFESSVLRMNYDVAAQIMAIGKAQHVSFMKMDPYKRRNFVESILGLVIFSKMSTIHSVKMTKHKEKLVEFKAAAASAGDKVKVRKKYISDLKESVRESEKKIRGDSKALVNALKDEISNLQEKIDSIEIPDTINTSSVEESLLNFQQLYLKLDMKIADTNKHIQHFETETVCRECLQELSPDKREAQKQDALLKLNEYSKARDEVVLKIEEFETQLKTSRDSNEARLRDVSTVEFLKREIESKTKQIERISNEQGSSLENLKSQIITETEFLIKLVDAHEKLKERYENLLQQTDYMNLVSQMLKDSGIKASLMKRYLPIINHSINNNLAELGFFAKFTLSETFDETIQARGIDTLSYNNFSEGEKLRIDMAILGAWRNIARIYGGVSTNLLIFDEIVDASLDAAGSDALMMLLSKLKDTNLFIVTHTPEKISDKVRSHIQFGKVDGFSKILNSPS